MKEKLQKNIKGQINIETPSILYIIEELEKLRKERVDKVGLSHSDELKESI
jgi:hypothetical protein